MRAGWLGWDDALQSHCPMPATLPPTARPRCRARRQVRAAQAYRYPFAHAFQCARFGASVVWHDRKTYATACWIQGLVHIASLDRDTRINILASCRTGPSAAPLHRKSAALAHVLLAALIGMPVLAAVRSAQTGSPTASPSVTAVDAPRASFPIDFPWRAWRLFSSNDLLLQDTVYAFGLLALDYLPPRGVATDAHGQLLLVLIDVDHFKRINDTHGHALGDVVLQAVAAHLRLGVRDSDMLVRWGGEEFLLALNECDPSLAGARLRAVLAAVGESGDRAWRNKITHFSIGWCGGLSATRRCGSADCRARRRTGDRASRCSAVRSQGAWPRPRGVGRGRCRRRGRQCALDGVRARRTGRNARKIKAPLPAEEGLWLPWTAISSGSDPACTARPRAR